jgi:ATP-dependent helicase/nuclease subunit A
VLVVCGALNKKLNEPEAGSWYDLVHSALAADAENVTKHKVGYSKEEVLRWRTPEFPPLAMEREIEKAASSKTPEWLTQTWQESAITHTRLRPSRLPREFTREAMPRSKGGKARGILLHRLLQSLPELASDEREAAARRYLAQAAPSLSGDLRAQLAREALGVIAHPDCAEIFGPDSRAEPELIAHIGEGLDAIEIPARLDRLVVTKDSVIFADFKSDAAVPASLAKIPKHYVTQLASYRTALAQAFPGRHMRALLIFTAGPRVFEIPEESLESAWQRLKSQTRPAFA